MDKCPYLVINLTGDEICGYCKLNEIFHPIESGLCKDCEENKEAILE